MGQALGRDEGAAARAERLVSEGISPQAPVELSDTSRGYDADAAFALDLAGKFVGK